MTLFQFRLVPLFLTLLLLLPSVDVDKFKFKGFLKNILNFSHTVDLFGIWDYLR